MNLTTYTCVECGHLHYLGRERYAPCPIESCECPEFTDAEADLYRQQMAAEEALYSLLPE